MLAVLFDIDGTLLKTSFNTLMQEYFQRIASRFAKHIEPKIFLKELNAATDVMIRNLDPLRLNLDVFVDHFFGVTGLDPTLWAEFSAFYREEFPQLAHLAEADQLAPKVVQTAFELEYKVVIATNPVFPLSAIRERLRWAGVDHFPYHLITAGENMHFCKPHVEYYREIADKIVVDPKDCIMVGDDYENDGAASKCGMETFILEGDQTLTTFYDILLTQKRSFPRWSSQY